jgi:hypothetical protein
MKASNNKTYITSVLSILLYGAIFSILSFVISWLLSNKLNINLSSFMSGIGIFIIILGVLTFVNGNPNGMGIGGIAHIGSTQASSQYMNYQNLEVTKMERESTKYYKNFMKHNVFKFNGSSLIIILYGIIIYLVSALIGKYDF